jgi:ribosomal subunit interface protein
MKINIAGQKIQIGQALQTHVNETLPEKLEKYWHKITSVHVNFSQVKGSLFLTQIIVHLGTGTHATIKSSGQGYNIYASYDEALEKAKKQVVKFKDKLQHVRLSLCFFVAGKPPQHWMCRQCHRQLFALNDTCLPCTLVCRAMHPLRESMRLISPV